MRGGCYTFYSDWECMTENEPYEELEEIKS